MSEATSGLNQIPPQTQEKKSFLSRIFGNMPSTKILDDERKAFMEAKIVATDTNTPQIVKVGNKNGDGNTEYIVSDPDKAGTQTRPVNN